MSYVIATSRPWNEIMAARLSERTGQPFHLITRKEDLTPERLREIAPRTVFFPHWSHLIPATIQEGWECVIFHMTDLPYGRGGSPLQNLIQRGHRETQLTALRCVAELDAGPVYLKRPLCLEGSASEIFLRAAGLIEDMIETIIREAPTPQPQQGEPMVFRRRKPEDSDLDQAPIQSLNDFFDFIRMLDADGYPRAFLDLHGHRMELSRVQLEQDRLVGTFVLYRQDAMPDQDSGGGGMIKRLLERCYPKPPRDVFQRMLSRYRPGDPLYTLEHQGNTVGMVYCARHSKGGHLENLAVDPAYRGKGLADQLVNALIKDNPGVITLTTRIPTYFIRLGFKPIQTLPDQSSLMIKTTPNTQQPTTNNQ
ncbi:hypothetical protein CKO31_21990 [Thiohalocapsa halophila]|uniref:N-acetyltransferase domain-containing protein n=1 Tax=Thiohalocapsa halophila TaxID=69359 RepID=A0ABS1CN83_9GAMM|nr:GNAT family N-acetyltransferase [Thiohalocapsa halophila]MBK1633375.1 hypothetical protein [Thiohalocapsa halophila]